MDPLPEAFKRKCHHTNKSPFDTKCTTVPNFNQAVTFEFVTGETFKEFGATVFVAQSLVIVRKLFFVFHGYVSSRVCT